MNPRYTKPKPADPRLRQSRIELVPKRVRFVPGMDRAGVQHDPDLVRELTAIVNSIQNGRGIPEANYRAGIDTDRDRLLDDHGVIHIHLKGKNSDHLVYLVQYDDMVVVLRTGTHAELIRVPPSSLLRDILKGVLKPYDLEAAQIRTDKAAAAAALQQQQIAARPGRIAAALKSLRRKPPGTDDEA